MHVECCEMLSWVSSKVFHACVFTDLFIIMVGRRAVAAPATAADPTSTPPADSLLFTLSTDLLCLIISKLPDARPAWCLLSSCRRIRIELASQPVRRALLPAQRLERRSHLGLHAARRASA